ncbi:MAG: phytanoyl-CoA dioxygenase family protein [Sphingobium sp.]
MSTTQADKALSLNIEELPDSAPLLADPEKLRERWKNDGVLYFRDVVDHDAIARIRDEYLARLKEMGVVDADETESNWNGKDRLDGALARLIGDEVWRDLVADPSLDRVVRTFLGEAPNWVPIVVHRSAPPLPADAKPETFGARHQDGIYNYGIDFVTCWIPLMDIDDEVGGLAVVPGSHKGSLYPPDVFKDPNNRVGIPAGAIPDSAWRRPNYKAGDILMFHSMTAHTGLPNKSGKIRLSTDIRFLPSSVAKPFVGQVITTDEKNVELKDESGEVVSVVIDEATIVRGPKGHPVIGEDRKGILFPDADIIVVPDERGHAKLIRSVSRKYVDLPATWYDSFPARWVK